MLKIVNEKRIKRMGSNGSDGMSYSMLEAMRKKLDSSKTVRRGGGRALKIEATSDGRSSTST